MNRLFQFALALISTGCYSYLPIQPNTAPRTAERVVLDLTPQGTVEMARYLGPSVRVAEGTLIAIANDGTLNVAVDFVQMTNGVKQPWAGEGAVNFPPAYVAVVRERHFEKRKTIVASVVTVGALIGAAIITMKQTGIFGGDGGGGVPPPP